MFDELQSLRGNDRETLPPPNDWDVGDERHTLRVVYVNPQRHTRYHTEACLTTFLDTHDPLCPCKGEVDNIDHYIVEETA